MKKISFRKILRSFFAEQSGIAATEFALMSPFLFLIFLGTTEASRYIITNQKLEKIAYTVADVVSQEETTTTASIDQLLAASQDIMNPYTFGSNGVIIITSVNQPVGGSPTVNWRYTGGGTLTGKTSAIGPVGLAATLPGGLTLNDSDNVIIAEVYYSYSPMFAGQGIINSTLYKVSIYKPRLGDLSAAPT